jgi:hypothetical protein
MSLTVALRSHALQVMTVRLLIAVSKSALNRPGFTGDRLV